MIRATILALTAIITTVILIPPSAFAHSGDVLQSGQTDTVPTLDGTASEGEWPEAIRISVETFPNKLDSSVGIAASHDSKNLYLLLKVDLPEDFSGQARFWKIPALYLDVNHDGTFNDGIDIVVRENNRGPQFGVYDTTSATGMHSRSTWTLERGVAWTGAGWVYELKIPFTLDSGYTWGGPGSDLGLALNWMVWEGETRNLNLNQEMNPGLARAQQIVVPSNATYVYTGSITKNTESFLSPTPGRFMDVILAKDQGPIEDTKEISDFIDVQGSADASNNSSLYIGIGVAAAGAAVAGAVVATRKRSQQKRG